MFAICNKLQISKHKSVRKEERSRSLERKNELNEIPDNDEIRRLQSNNIALNLTTKSYKNIDVVETSKYDTSYNNTELEKAANTDSDNVIPLKLEEGTTQVNIERDKVIAIQRDKEKEIILHSVEEIKVENKEINLELCKELSSYNDVKVSSNNNKNASYFQPNVGGTSSKYEEICSINKSTSSIQNSDVISPTEEHKQNSSETNDDDPTQESESKKENTVHKMKEDVRSCKVKDKATRAVNIFKDEILSDSEDVDSETSSVKSYEKHHSNDNSSLKSEENSSAYDHSDEEVRRSKRNSLKMCLRSAVSKKDGKITYSIKNYINYNECNNAAYYDDYGSWDEDGEKQYPLDFCDMTMEVNDDEIYSPEEVKLRNEEVKELPKKDEDYTPLPPKKQKKRKIREPQDYKCFRCSKSFDTFFHLKRHRKTHASKRFPCSVCNFRATTKERLLDHEDSHFQAKIYQCTHCDYGTNVRRYFRAHERNIHKIKNLKCTECDYETHRNEGLRLHIMGHADTPKFKCSTCEYTTNRKDYFKIHEMNHSEEKRFKCPKCDYATNYKRNLKLHDTIHQEMKMLKCSICDYETNRKQSFKLHELNHSDSKKFHCDKCSYATNGKLNLRQHSLTHLATKRFKCPACEYATNFKSNFKNHEKIHLNVKLLKCPDCNYETNIKQSLKTHMFYHSETKRFKCSLCDFCTNYKTTLNHHELTHVNSFVENY